MKAKKLNNKFNFSYFMNIFEKMIFELYKNKRFSSSLHFYKVVKKEYPKITKIEMRKIYREIVIYQVKTFGESLS